MPTSERSRPDRPGHAETENGDEPASVRTTPDRGARTCPAKALVVAKRDRKAFSTGCTSSSTMRSLSMVPCTVVVRKRSHEATIWPSRRTCVRQRASAAGSTCHPVRSRRARRWRGSALPCLQWWCGSDPKGKCSLPRERTPRPRAPRPSLVRPRRRNTAEVQGAHHRHRPPECDRSSEKANTDPRGRPQPQLVSTSGGVEPAAQAPPTRYRGRHSFDQLIRRVDHDPS